MLGEVSNGSPSDAPTDPVLTIGYSTLASRVAFDRAASANGPTSRSWSSSNRRPAECQVRTSAERGDARVILDDGVGVARSRNIVLEQAAVDTCSSVTTTPPSSRRASTRSLEVMERDPGVSFLQGRALDETGRPRKRYPKRATRLSRWNSAKIGTIELMVRRADIVDNGDPIRRTVRGRGRPTISATSTSSSPTPSAPVSPVSFVPVSIAVHPAASSGLPGGGRHDARARSVVFGRVVRLVGAASASGVPAQAAPAFRLTRAGNPVRRRWSSGRVNRSLDRATTRSARSTARCRRARAARGSAVPI